MEHAAVSFCLGAEQAVFFSFSSHWSVVEGHHQGLSCQYSEGEEECTALSGSSKLEGALEAGATVWRD